MTTIARTTRNAPVPVAARNTLLDVATILQGNPLLADPAGLYNSLNCITTDTVTTMCPDARGTKTFGSVQRVDGIRIPVYSGVTCRLVGADWDQIPADLARVQRDNESQAVEKALMQTRFTGTAGGAAATDLTPVAGAVSPKVGVAILEGHARHFYAGLPTIHAPATLATLLYQDLFKDGGNLVTGLGSKIAFGAGYEYPNNGPSGAAPAAGSLWMYATGEVTVERGPYRQVDPQISYSTNEAFGLIETFYVADVDCYVSAVRVNIA